MGCQTTYVTYSGVKKQRVEKQRSFLCSHHIKDSRENDFLGETVHIVSHDHNLVGHAPGFLDTGYHVYKLYNRYRTSDLSNKHCIITFVIIAEKERKPPGKYMASKTSNAEKVEEIVYQRNKKRNRKPI